MEHKVDGCEGFWIDVTTLSDRDPVQICVECRAVRRAPRTELAFETVERPASESGRIPDRRLQVLCLALAVAAAAAALAVVVALFRLG